MLRLETNSPQETEHLGQLFGASLKAASFVALYGDLGGGKTCFTRGLVKSIAPKNSHLVSSPTYTIMNEYKGDSTVYHFDFYRLTGSYDIYELGFDDYFNGDGICIVEWAERLEELFPEESLSITFTYLSYTSRQLQFRASGMHSIEMLQLFKSSLNT